MKIDKELAYFIGVLHSDGCIYRFEDKERKRVSMRLNLTIASKSLPMAYEFQRILSSKFSRVVNVRKVPNKNSYVIQTSINRLYPTLKNWINYALPQEIKSNVTLFGAYLGGLIDGDGHVKLKNNKDRKLKQVLVSITGPVKILNVKECIERFTNSKVNFSKVKGANCFETYFYVTYKNSEFLFKRVMPHIQMSYKNERLRSHINKINMSPQGFEFQR